MDNNYLGNITTLISYIVSFIFPYLATYGFTHEQITGLIGGVIIFLFMIINSKFPNTFKFLDNHNLNITAEAQTEEEIIETNDYEEGGA